MFVAQSVRAERISWMWDSRLSAMMVRGTSVIWMSRGRSVGDGSCLSLALAVVSFCLVLLSLRCGIVLTLGTICRASEDLPQGEVPPACL